jgi:hypothetical protein
LLGRDRDGLTAWTGAVAAIEGWFTAAIPAFLLLTGWWDALPNAAWAAIVAVLTIGGLVIARARLGSRVPAMV